jgi:CheY-like chemotaxis protein
LVDDEENVLKSLENVLRRLGYSVVGKKDGKEALSTFLDHAENFDLVITDQIMPEISGTELSKKILEIRPDIPIVICTGFSDKIDKKKIKRLGIRELVLKPLKMNEIARIIRGVLDECRLRNIKGGRDYGKRPGHR